VFANQGRLAYPRLNLNVPASSSEVVFSKKTIKTMLGFLERVTAPGGTGTLSKINIQGYRVAGKTGTSRKLENGKYVRKYVTTFVGLIPASSPKYIIAVIIDEPTKKGFSGGLVSAPVFSEVAQTVLRVYNIPPDAPENATNHQPLEEPHVEVPEDN
jgi:cell division protein FtsI (penicillin-binding protein 3)